MANMASSNPAVTGRQSSDDQVTYGAMGDAYPRPGSGASSYSSGSVVEGRRLTSKIIPGVGSKTGRSKTSPQTSPRPHSPVPLSFQTPLVTAATSTSSAPTSAHYGSPSKSGKEGRQWVEAMRGACDRTRDRTRGLLKRFRNSEHSMTLDGGMGRNAGPRRSVSIDMDPVTSSADQRVSGVSGASTTVAGMANAPGHNSADSSWTVHVWSTWVSRPSMDEDDFNMALLCGEDGGSAKREEPRSKCPEPTLTDAQRRKLTCFFSCFLDRDKDGFVTIDDLNSLAEKIRHYTDWSPDHEDFVAVLDLHAELWEYFKPMKPTLAMSSKKKSSMAAHMVDGCGAAFDPDADWGVDVLVTEPELIDLASWLRCWADLVARARGSISYLPDWIMVLMKILFRTLNRRANGRLCVAELRDFYSCFLGVAPSAAHKIAKEGYLSMTGDGLYVLNLDTFHLVFANFLFGASEARGPGHYLMPCCLEEDRPFPIKPAPMSPDKKPKFDPLNDPDLRH